MSVASAFAVGLRRAIISAQALSQCSGLLVECSQPSKLLLVPCVVRGLHLLYPLPRN
jgi:hypothetical protein